MDRIDGFINLDKLLGLEKPDTYEDFKSLEDRITTNKNVVVTKVNGNFKFNFCFNYKGKKYFFGYDSMADPYIELIIEEIAKDLDIPYVNHDIAQIGDYRGVVSENYKVKGAKYISMYDILNEFYNKEDPNPTYVYPELKEIQEYFQRKDNGTTHNNLEGIWVALEDRYKNRTDMQEIVSKIMRKIVDIFALDIITGQFDRNSTNLEIVEYSDGSVNLQPIFDNGRAMQTDPYINNLSLTVDHDFWRNQDDNIERFLRFSSSEFKNTLTNFLWVISEENINNILKRVEDKTGHKFRKSTKETYLLKFKIYSNFLYDELGLDDYPVIQK